MGKRMQRLQLITLNNLFLWIETKQQSEATCQDSDI